MTTTNSTTGQKFLCVDHQSESEWSEPIYVDQGGLDPSSILKSLEFSL